MKASELRIGNWINDVNDGKDYQITLADFYNIYIDDNCLFTPITITEEWLLKFGWVWNERTNSYENSDTRMHLEYRPLNGSYKMFNYVLKAIICERIWHVHQLQNLYFALTGEELTFRQ